MNLSKKIRDLSQGCVISARNLDLLTLKVNKLSEVNDNQLSLADCYNQLALYANSLATNEDDEDLLILAGRLYINSLYEKYFGGNIPIFSVFVKSMIERGLYNPKCFNLTNEEFDSLNQVIDHQRDYSFSYAAVNQLANKYLIKNKLTNEIYELPQFLYLAVSVAGFINYNPRIRLKYIIDFYHALSTFRISIATPILTSLRTGQYSLSSCVVIDVDDSIDSITSGASISMKYITQRSGIGLNLGRIRSIGSAIRGGREVHAGIVPIVKLYQNVIKACSQTGVRSGSATIFFPIFHLEIENILSLKNNRGSEEQRARHLDYGIQLCRLFYERLIKNEKISLFNSYLNPEVFEAFYRGNHEKFTECYERAESLGGDKITKVLARELFTKLMSERAQTGRIYIQNIDHTNNYSSFNDLAPAITMSNLCMEITLPTTPAKSDNNYEIGLCTLGAFNLGKLANLDDLKDLSKLLVRFLDQIIEHQNYLTPQISVNSRSRRSLGIGVTNLAYYLVKNDCPYDSNNAKILVHQLFERLQYELLDSSADLALDSGPCKFFYQTKYADGILPIDNYKKDIDSYIDQVSYQCDWELLRQKIRDFGLRNSTLSAIMPCETTALLMSATNGIEFPRSLVSVKSNKDGNLKQICPEASKFKDNYQLAWNLINQKSLVLIGIMQKFVDQSISTNTYYDPAKYPNNLVSLQHMLDDLLLAYKLGIKTLYYHNTKELVYENLVTNTCTTCSL